MPKEIPLVSEKNWKVVDAEGIRIGAEYFSRNYVSISKLGSGWDLDELCIFTESCRQKLLAAMDSFGKVEEPEHWKNLTKYAAEGNSISKAILDLRDRIVALEGKVK